MTKATRILNEYHIKELILKGNPQYENFYKEELIEFCKISKHEIERLNNIIDNARKYIENNQSGCENENGHFHLNFDGDIWELYEMLRRF